MSDASDKHDPAWIKVLRKVAAICRVTDPTDRSDPAWVKMLRQVAVAYSFLCGGFLLGCWYSLWVAPPPPGTWAPPELVIYPLVISCSSLVPSVFVDSISLFIHSRQRIRRVRAQALHEAGLG